MKMPVAMAARAAIWAHFIRLVLGAPTIGFPINAQVPPVARISEAFSFVFAENTFLSSSTSPSSPITYSLKNPPDWLSIDSNERWLHGTPRDGDVPAGNVVGIPFSLVATDDTGSTTQNVTLVVSRSAAPTVQIPISQQLADSGIPYSEPSSLLSYPDSHFNFTFSPSTFSSSGLNYYAVSGDNSPLPSWIAFDAGQIAFTGTTPPADSLIEPPQTFNFQLIASDVTGFSAASIAFSIVVGSHEITVDNPSVILNATVGKTLVYNGLQNGVRIDGKVAGPSNLTATVLSGLLPPDWLNFDVNTWELSGTPPSSAQNAAFAIGFSDTLSDMVNVTFQVDIDEDGTLFRGMLPAVQAQRGGQFSLDLAPYLRQTAGVGASVQTQPETDWIEFDNKTLTVSGDVPISETASTISISVRATSESSNATESETFLLQILSQPPPANSSATAATPASSASSTSTAEVGGSNSSSTSLKTILLAVLIPTTLLGLVLLVIACCACRRRRRKQRALSQSLTNKDISDPVPLSFAYNGQEDIVSSMRALDKEYKISNLNNAYAQQQSNQEKERLQEQDMPVGTALTTTGSEKSQVKSKAIMSIPEFPPPPIRAVPSKSSSSSSAGSGKAPESITGGQWPFEESTLKSSVPTTSSRGDLHSNLDQQDLIDYRDALGIYGSLGSLSSRMNSESHITRQTVRTSTPMQLDVMTPSEGVGPSGSSGFPVDRRLVSQEAVIHDAQRPTTAATVAEEAAVGNQTAPDDGRCSAEATADGSRSTLYSNVPDVETAAPGGGGFGDQTQRKSFLSGIAARIASTLKKGVPIPKARSRATHQRRFSQAAGFPSPDAPSFDTDLGSVTIGNITTAQPYRPRPVFIGSVNRITEESPQPNSLWWNRDNGGSRPATAIAKGGAQAHGSKAAAGASTQDAGGDLQIRLVHTNSNKRQQGHGVQATRESGNGGENEAEGQEDDDNHSSVDNDHRSEDAGDAAIHLDPPRPAFLAPSRVERDGTTDLSREIASSLGSRRPTSSGSSLSGISAAMEEVRSLLLLPYDSPDGRSHGGNVSSPSSDSWETLPSSEPNWTSLFNYVLPARQANSAAAAAGAAAGTPETLGTSTNAPPTPATAAAVSVSASVRPEQADAHMLHPARAKFVFPTVTAVEPEATVENNGHAEDEPVLTSRYRATSSYYGEAPIAITNDDEYPAPFVVDNSNSGGSAEQDSSTGGIGLAVSKYSQSQLATQASLPSTVSSGGIRAFI